MATDIRPHLIVVQNTTLTPPIKRENPVYTMNVTHSLKSLAYLLGSRIWSLSASIHMQSWSKVKLGHVGVGSNIAQWSNLQKIITGHYLAQFKWKVNQKWNYVKLELVGTLRIIIYLGSMKLYIWSLLTQFKVEQKWNICKVEVSLNIVQNHSSTLWEVVSDHCELQFTLKVNQKLKQVKGHEVNWKVIRFPIWVLNKLILWS